MSRNQIQSSHQQPTYNYYLQHHNPSTNTNKASSSQSSIMAKTITSQTKAVNQYKRVQSNTASALEKNKDMPVQTSSKLYGSHHPGANHPSQQKSGSSYNNSSSVNNYSSSSQAKDMRQSSS